MCACLAIVWRCRKRERGREWDKERIKEREKERKNKERKERKKGKKEGRKKNRKKGGKERRKEGRERGLLVILLECLKNYDHDATSFQGLEQVACREMTYGCVLFAVGKTRGYYS